VTIFTAVKGGQAQRGKQWYPSHLQVFDRSIRKK
jgi:hypothetical protein